MQSNEYQVVKRTRKFHMNPQSGGDQVVTSSKVRTFGSTRTGGAGEFSSFGMGGALASGKREMNPLLLVGTEFISLDEAALLVHPKLSYQVQLKASALVPTLTTVVLLEMKIQEWSLKLLEL